MCEEVGLEAGLEYGEGGRVTASFSLDGGMKRVRVEDDWRAREGCWQVRRSDGGVRGGQVVENFEGEEEYFETNAMFDREPVKRLQNRSDVFVGLGVGEVAPAESRTIWSLWRDLGGDSIEKRIAIVMARGDEDMDEEEGFSHTVGLIAAMQLRNNRL